MVKNAIMNAQMRFLINGQSSIFFMLLIHIYFLFVLALLHHLYDCQHVWCTGASSALPAAAANFSAAADAVGDLTVLGGIATV